MKKTLKTSKYKNLRNLTLNYALRFKAVALSTVFCGVLSNIFNLLTLLLGALLVGKAFQGAEANEISRFFPLLIAFALVKGLFAYLHMLITHDLAYRTLEAMRIDVYDAVERGTPLTVQKYHSGNLSSIVMEDVEGLEVFFAHILVDYVIAAISIVVFFGIFAYFSVSAALLSLVFALIVASLPYTFGKRKEKLGRVMRDARGENATSVMDAIQGLQEILIFNREKKYIRKVIEDTLFLNRLEIKDGFIKGVQTTLMNFVMSVFFVLIILLANHFVLAGSLSGEYLSVFIAMSLNVFIPVLGVSATAGNLNSVVASADRVGALLQEKSHLLPTNKNLPMDAKDMILRFDNVSFAYERNHPVLKGISFDISSGENIAIVGASGSGKSTILNLMMRFYDPDEGNIYLNGKNTRSMDPEEVRNNIGFVPQVSILFNGTLLSNLKLGKPDASERDVKTALHIACAEEFIGMLPDGQHTLVDEGGYRFSGGERQRLAIARALIKASPILIMDEAVSNLDTESEKLFRRALMAIKEEKTFIAVAHRLSTIMEADRILEIEDGKIIFDGSIELYKQKLAEKKTVLFK